MKANLHPRILGFGIGSSALALAVALAACGPSGSNETPSSSVTGVVASDSAVAGTIALRDSAAAPQERSATVDESGAFAIDATGLTAPFVLKAQPKGGRALYSASARGGKISVNPLTDAAVRAMDDDGDDEVDDEYEHDDGERRRQSVRGFQGLIDQLQTVLKPLFDLYGVPADPFTSEGADPALRELLQDVRIAVRDGKVVVTNIATGAVIFSGPLRNLSTGTFDPANMPGGTTTPPAPTACAYTYSAWSTCANGTQTRTVASATPAGCTGTPALSQACTVTPPAPVTCSSYTYSAWTACQPNNTQTRTVLASMPSGCTGGTPVTSQACTYVPPPVTCSAFTYSAWGACQPNNTQTRTVATSSPAGCVGGTPVTSQACTYVPPVPACTYSTGTWGACQPNGTQTRTVTASPSGCTGTPPASTQACTYVPPTCSTFTYSAWGACQSNNTQTRTVATSSPAGCVGGTPVLSQACTYTPPTTSCTTCHGIPPANGKHAFHSSFASCATCHGTGYSTTTANAATHMNGVKNLTSTVGWNGTSCANACHGSKNW